MSPVIPVEPAAHAAYLQALLDILPVVNLGVVAIGGFVFKSLRSADREMAEALSKLAGDFHACRDRHNANAVRITDLQRIDAALRSSESKIGQLHEKVNATREELAAVAAIMRAIHRELSPGMAKQAHQQHPISGLLDREED